MKKKNKIDSCILTFILTGIIPTVILFVMYNAMGKYGMNPLAYIVCILPIILTSPLLLFVESKDKNKNNKK